MFSTSLVAVPAFSRVEPLSTSGPTTGVIARSTRGMRSESGLHDRPMVNAPSLAGVIDRPEDVRRAAAGGDADEHIGGGERDRGEVAGGVLGVVLGPFDGPRQGGRAAGDEADDQPGRGVERRRALGGVEHAEPAGGAGPDVDSRPPPRSRSAITSMARAIASACDATAGMTFASSAFISRTSSSGVSSSSSAEAGLRASV